MSSGGLNNPQLIVRKADIVIERLTQYCKDKGLVLSELSKHNCINIDYFSNPDAPNFIYDDIEKLLKGSGFKRLTQRQYHNGRVTMLIGKRQDESTMYLNFQVM